MTQHQRIGGILCPHVESSDHLCDRIAYYQIDGLVLCPIHARRAAEQRMDTLYRTVTEFDPTQKRIADIMDWQAAYERPQGGYDR